jgi:hypothetical protein
MNLDRLKIPSLTCVTALGLLLANNVKPANALSFADGPLVITETSGTYSIKSVARAAEINVDIEPSAKGHRYSFFVANLANSSTATDIKSWQLPLFGNDPRTIHNVLSPLGWTYEISAWANNFNSAPPESGKSTRTPTHLLTWKTDGAGIGYGSDTDNPFAYDKQFGFDSVYGPDLRVASQVILGNGASVLIDPLAPGTPQPPTPPGDAVPTPSLILGIGAVAYRAVKRRRQLSDDLDQGAVSEPIA